MPSLFPLVLVAALPAGPEPAAVTYSKEIAPIFQKRCQECHRPGEAAPMSLLTYADARPWAKSIKKLVAGREMPPWHADPAHGKWKNDPRLSDDELRSIVDWVDAGAPEGDPQDHPKPLSFVEGWGIGKPDAVFTLPEEVKVKPEGEVPYKYFIVPTGFTEDRWVQAAEARPGNRAVVHHIIVFVLEPGERKLAERDTWKRHLCGVAPGEAPDVFPRGTAKRIKAGSSLLFQMHYTPNGKATTDRSQVGLIFAREPVEKEIRVNGILNPFFAIPPGAPSHPVQSKHTFRDDVTLLSLMPHMHLRGKDFRYEVVHPDGKRETLLDVPRYDFNWQHSYVFETPLQLKKGAQIICSAHFDNSPANKANPDPSKEVHWGDQTWEEMMIGFVTFTKDEEKLGIHPSATPPAAPKEPARL